MRQILDLPTEEAGTSTMNGKAPDDRLADDLSAYADLLLILDEFDFIWPNEADCLLAAKSDLNCWSATRPRIEHFVRRRKIIVCCGDDEQGLAWGKESADRYLGHKAEEVRVCRIPEYGSKYPTLADWSSHYSLIRTLDLLWQAGIPVVSVSDPAKVSPIFEGDPQPIAIDLVSIPGLDPRMIPEPLRTWLVDIANRGSFPLEYGAAAAIVGLSGLLGRRLAIRPKRHDDWLVVPNLWGAIVGPPGIQKTPAVEEALRPLRRLAADAMRAHEANLQEYAHEQLIAAARKSTAKKELEAAAKKGATSEELAVLAHQVVGEGTNGQPKPKRYIVNDTTVEKLGELLAENPYGLTLFRDELSGFLRTLDKQGHESDRGFYLEAWNGNGSYTFDRIGRGTVFIPNTCLAVFGTIQPGPLAKYLQASLSGEEADGFVPRFQILLYPDPPHRFIHCDRYPDTEAKSQAYSVFQALDRLDPVALGCAVDSDRSIPYIGFSEEAQQFFDDWRIELENRLRSGALSSVLTSHLAKYRSLLPSLALVFHVIASHHRPVLGPVSIDAVTAAGAWCDLLEAHAERIYHAAYEGDPDDAVRLAERLKDSLSNPFSIRDVQRKCWSGLTSNEEVRRAVRILEDRNWLKTIEAPSTDAQGRGRPSEQVWIHPKVVTPTECRKP
jgi:putative DNA primase/helicase